MDTTIIPEPNFNPDPRPFERNDFPTAEFIIDQVRDAADDVVVEIVAFAAVTAIEQRDSTRAVLRASLAQLHRLNAEVDRLRSQLHDQRERAQQSRKAA